MRKRAYVVVLVLAVLAMVQRPAYAMTARIPWGDMSGDWAYCSGKHLDAYSAAAELAGYDLSSLTQEQRTALLDKNGDYVAYGQLAERLTTLAQVADDFGGAITSFFNANGWFELMGLDEIWVYRAHNDDLIDQASLDIRDCINEHPRATGNPGTGGGGSGGSGNVPNVFTGNPQLYTSNVGTSYNNRFNYVVSEDGITYICKYTTGTFAGDTTLPLGPFPITVVLPSSMPDFSFEGAYDFICTLEKYGAYGQPTFRCTIYALESGSYTINYLDNGNSTQYFNLRNIQFNKQTSVYYLRTEGSFPYTYNNGTFDFTGATYGNNEWQIQAVGTSSGLTATSSGLSVSYVASGSSVIPPTYTPTLPQYPDNDIPDPTNINLPDIIMPNITLPNIYPPSTQPSNPTYNTYTYNTYNTATGQDVIPYLRNIIEWLSEIDLDIVSGLNALGSIMDGVNTQIRQQIKWLFDSLDVELDAGVMAINETIGSYVDALAGLINDAFEDSFYDLKLWLKDALTKIKNEISDFDDDMMYELKLIRRKMGGGRSSEPSAKDNPDDWLKWWSDLISKLLEKLAGALPDELLELVEDFKALGQKFPFSIPWDIAYLVGLFAHSPVTPVFDYPVPYGYANGELLVASIHIDLSPWNDVALAIRNTQLVGFAIWLAFNTSKLSLYLKLPGSKGE